MVLYYDLPVDAPYGDALYDEDTIRQNRNTELSQSEVKARSGRLRNLKVRSNMKDHGHGTLCEDDYLETKYVDVDCIDKSVESMAREFGNPGMLPEKYRAERAIKIFVRPHTVASVEFPLSEGRYLFAILHESKGLFSFRMNRPVQIKAWVCNKSKGYSVVTCSERLCSKKSLLKLDFDVPSNDTCYLLLRIYADSRLLTTVLKCMLKLKSVSSL